MWCTRRDRHPAFCCYQPLVPLVPLVPLAILDRSERWERPTGGASDAVRAPHEYLAEYDINSDQILQIGPSPGFFASGVWDQSHCVYPAEGPWRRWVSTLKYSRLVPGASLEPNRDGIIEKALVTRPRRIVFSLPNQFPPESKGSICTP